MKAVSTAKKTARSTTALKGKARTSPVKKAPSKAKKSLLSQSVSIQKIQEKAYEIFLQRNGAPGSAEQDWIEAERIIKGL